MTNIVRNTQDAHLAELEENTVARIGGIGNPMLNDNDCNALADLQSGLSVVRDRVRGVAAGWHTGFYFFGPPGTGKTHIVLETLKRDNVESAYHHGHLTPVGLFELLEESPNAILVLDDVADILNRPVALQILLAALGNQASEPGERKVKYRRQGVEVTVVFKGGIIMLSNLQFHAAPLLDALGSRIHTLHHNPTDAQIAALMRDIASRGWPLVDPKITPAEGIEIAEFVINESQKRNCRLDLRLLVDKAFPDYLQDRDGQTETHWKDLVRVTLAEQLLPLEHTQAGLKTRQATKEAEYQIIRRIAAEHESPHDRVAAWIAITHKSERAYYRRLEEIELRPGDTLEDCQNCQSVKLFPPGSPVAVGSV